MMELLVIILATIAFLNKRDNNFNDKKIERLEEQVKFLNEELGIK